MRRSASFLTGAALLAACGDSSSPRAVSEPPKPSLAVALTPCPGCAYGVVRFDRTLGGRFEQATFAADPAASWVLVVTDDGNATTGAEVVLNGTQRVAKAALEGAPTAVRIPVSLLASNTLLVRVFGAVGNSVRVSVEPGPVPTLTVAPQTAERTPHGTLQFSIAAGPAGPYRWSVNNTDGGNATFGTISAGLYTAPAAVPTPSTFQVCVRVVANPAVRGCATMAITPAPTAGTDVVVFNDVNLFDNTALTDPSNRRLVRNLVNFAGSGPRASGRDVVIEGGHSSTLAACLGTDARAEIAGQGYTVVARTSATVGAQPATVKVLLLCLPNTPYSRDEINTFKQFSAQGGRLVFVGEHAGVYGGIPVQNQFLADMGAAIRNVGELVDCGGYFVLPAASLRPQQITAGLTQLTIGCASAMTLGTNDVALFYDRSNTRVLAGVAKVNVTPLAASGAPRGATGSSAGAFSPTHDFLGRPIRR